jgi:hypothetical protein
MKDLVELVISDPWEWQTELGPGPLVAEIVDRSEDYSLFRLATPVTFQGRQVELLVAAPRHQGQVWNELAEGQSVPASFAFADTDREWQTTATRHGVDLIGAIRGAAAS